MPRRRRRPASLAVGKRARASCPSHGRPVGQHIDDGLLETRRDIRALLIASGPAPSRSTVCATAVFRPEKLRSHPGRRSIGRGNAIARRIALVGKLLQSRSARPAEPSSLATLSNASPAASSTVPPSRTCCPTPSHRDALRMAAGQQQQQVGKRRPALDQAGQPSRQRMRLQMIDGNERQSLAIATPLPNWHPTIKPADQPRPDVAATPPSQQNPTPALAIVRRTCSER